MNPIVELAECDNLINIVAAVLRWTAPAQPVITIRYLTLNPITWKRNPTIQQQLAAVSDETRWILPTGSQCVDCFCVSIEHVVISMRPASKKSTFNASGWVWTLPKRIETSKASFETHTHTEENKKKKIIDYKHKIKKKKIKKNKMSTVAYLSSGARICKSARISRHLLLFGSNAGRRCWWRWMFAHHLLLLCIAIKHFFQSKYASASASWSRISSGQTVPSHLHMLMRAQQISADNWAEKHRKHTN